MKGSNLSVNSSSAFHLHRAIRPSRRGRHRPVRQIVQGLFAPPSSVVISSDLSVQSAWSMSSAVFTRLSSDEPSHCREKNNQAKGNIRDGSCGCADRPRCEARIHLWLFSRCPALAGLRSAYQCQRLRARWRRSIDGWLSPGTRHRVDGRPSIQASWIVGFYR